MRTFIIREDHAQAIADYLSIKPYAEVFMLIRILESLVEQPAATVARAGGVDVAPTASATP